MEFAQPEPDFDWSPHRRRVWRGLTVMIASVLTIAIACLAYLHPTLPWSSTITGGAPAGTSAYRVTTVDFVDQRAGWLVAVLATGDYAVMHTANGGLSWTHQWSVRGDGHAHYMKFFGTSVGIFALTGTRPILHRTLDGGRTWSTVSAIVPAGSVVLSWSFVDAERGWMLVDDPEQIKPSSNRLYRTDDGGKTWGDLGPPVKAPDRAFQVHFSNPTTGWLTTASAGAYAYRTFDLGVTWSRVPLPSPPVFSSRFGEFFVAVHPTSGSGALLSVIYFSSIQGRSGVGGRIRGFPPLTVSGFDGGRPQTYTFSTVMDQVAGGPFGLDVPPNEVRLSTLDDGARWQTVKPPSPGGAIGYFDARNWWWIGSGALSRSRDGGVTWTDQRGINANIPIPGSLQVLDRDHGWFAALEGTRPVLEVTSDGGSHWQKVKLPAIPDAPPYALT
jgi:photosystem II stability/assembly factor-like uncharacterized protein